jgi:hypothetical protein
MNDLTKRTISVLPGPNRLTWIVVLSVALATSGCSVVEQFASPGARSCSCGEDTCAESLACCGATAASGLNASSQITYPQLLPTFDAGSPPGRQTPTDPWVNRQQIQRPAGNLSCEAQLQEARVDFDQKLESFEARFEEERRANDAINGQLQTLNGTVDQLSDDVDYWKDEVRRIDRTAEMHHRSDMNNMRSIMRMIDEFNPGTAATSVGEIPATRTQ